MKEKKIETNLKNIIAIDNCSKKLNINYWLFGRTLLFAYKANMLSNEDETEVCIEIEKNQQKIDIINLLKIQGFKIHKTFKRSSYLKNNRKILIIRWFFNEKSIVRINSFNLNSKHFKSFSYINILGYDFKIPKQSNYLLNELYSNNLVKSIKQKFYLIIDGEFSFITTLRITFHWLADSYPISKMIIQKLFFIIKNKKIPKGFYSIKKLSIDEFKNLELDSSSFNWEFRNTHLNIISNNGKYRKVGDIISYLKDEFVFNKLLSELQETPTNKTFSEPLYWSRKFWKNGNNFFINPIIFGFRKKVVQYEKANKYIKSKNYPYLYTRKYYDNLEIMSDMEVTSLLKKNPLEVFNKGFSSGRHRACAMIGRLIRNEKYLPIYVITLPD